MTQALTLGLVTRHFSGRSGGWDPAMLDIAQDHALCHLAEQGVFDLGLVFKGGTALRKCRSGVSGRFSTDLDFSCADLGLAHLVMESLDGLTCHGFTFTLADLDTAAGRAALLVDAPLTMRPPHAPGRVLIPAKIEISPRGGPWIPAEHLPLIRSNVHSALGHDIPALPIYTVTESIAEKLARYSRTPLARDLYDLYWYGSQGALDEAAIRRMWLLKVWGDFVLDGRWSRTFAPSEILIPRKSSDIDEESIGFLTHPPDIAGWEQGFRTRYAFLAELDGEDKRWARCHAGDRHDYNQLTGATYG